MPPIYVGSEKVSELYVGGSKIKEVYVGSHKVFSRGGGGECLVIDGISHRIGTMPDGRVWMCENCMAIQGSAYFIKNDESLYKVFGRMYYLSEAKAVASRVDGWHLPSIEEYKTLFGSASDPINKFTSSSSNDWDLVGTDDFGFSLPGSGSCVIDTNSTPNDFKQAINIMTSSSDRYGGLVATIRKPSSLYYWDNVSSGRRAFRLIKDA